MFYESLEWGESMDMDKRACEYRASEGIFVYNSTSPVRAHLWFLPALIYCYLLALLIEKWRMRRAAYCMAPVLLAILLWRAEFCVFLTDFITLWNTETFCLQE